MRSLLPVLAALTVTFSASAQEIYRWVDKDGVVHFSDQPGSDKAELITVLEPSTFQGPDEGGDSASPASGSSARVAQEPEISPYRGMAIVAPTPDQVFFGADAVVTATANLDGTLLPDHSVVFFLNGNRHQAQGLSAEFTNLARGTYFLRASVLDQAGRPVISSQQTTFHVRQPSINSPQSPQAPRPPPRPTPTPSR